MFENKKLKIFLRVLYVAAAIGGAGIAAFAAGFEPGSQDDPVVTKSYVDRQIEEIGISIETKISNLYSEIESIGKEEPNQDGNTGQMIQIVEVQAGGSIIFEAGTQAVLRGGSATIIDSDQGGIADLTQGADLRMGYEVPANHLLLIPRSDGRGIRAVSKCILMVTGGYEIK